MCYRFGKCVPYKTREKGNQCDFLYTPDVDNVYVSFQRENETFDDYIDFVESAGLLPIVLPRKCIDPFMRVFCHFLLPPCGNSTVLELPTSVCMESCKYVQEICPLEWEKLLAHFEPNEPFLRRNGVTLFNCSNTGEYLNPLPHCCSDVLVDTCMCTLIIYSICRVIDR